MNDILSPMDHFLNSTNRLFFIGVLKYFIEVLEIQNSDILFQRYFFKSSYLAVNWRLADSLLATAELWKT